MEASSTDEGIMSKKKSVTTKLILKDYEILNAIAIKNDLSKSEVLRRALRLALRWHRMSFIERVKRCFFSF